MAESPPNWHFEYLAAIYDYLSFDRNYEPILDGLDVAAGDRVLDLAGGTGAFLEALGERTSIRADDSYLVDLSRAMIQQARGRGIRSTVLGDTASLPFGDGRFDGAFAGDAVHHMGDPVAVFREVRRVLAPGGRFVIEEFDPSRLMGKLLYGMERLSGMGSQFMEPPTLKGLIEQIDWADVTLRRDGFVYYLIARA